jgi:hypothetical protein
MSTLHSHTHWQSPQANTQVKACQRVCLSNPQTDTKTFGQLVAKLGYSGLKWVLRHFW